MKSALFFAGLLLAAAPALPSQAEAKGTCFREIAARAGIARVPSKRVVWADFDGDGRPDVLLDRKQVFLNRPGKKKGERVFKEVPGAIPEKIEAWRGIVLPGDVNGDGKLDLYWGVYCDFQKPKVEKGRVVLDARGRPVPAVKDDGRRSCILLGDGKGRFHILEKSGVEDPPSTVCAAAFLDYDKDGILDLFTGSWYKAYGVSLECYPDRLYKGLGGGKFKDVTKEAGMMTDSKPGSHRSSKPTYGAATIDWNNDGWTDILVCVYGRQWNMLWKNNGDGTFTEVGARTGWDGDAIRDGRYPEIVRVRYHRADEKPFRSNGNTFDVSAGDIDNDGDMDLFSGEITHWWAGPSSDLSMFLINLGKAGGWKFQRRPDLVPRRRRGRTWNQGDIHTALFDYDNDGWLDLVIASSDYPDGQFLRLYRNLGGKAFEEVTSKAGFHWRSPAGISLSDFDGDGRLDLLCGRSHMRLTKEQKKESPLATGLWWNRCGKGNHWLELRLRGAGKGGANTCAIGARVIARAGKHRWIREIQGGAGHAGHDNDFLVHFGLGKVKRLDSVEILWPDKAGSRTVLKDVAADRLLDIHQ